MGQRPSSISRKWIAVRGVMGVRYREHLERVYLRKPDRYFAIRYRVVINGKSVLREEGVGWASEGYTSAKAADLRAMILQKIDELGRPYSLAEHRSDRGHAARADAAATILDLQRNATFGYACARYLEWAEGAKKSWRADASRIAHHLRPYLGEYRMVDITPVLIESFRGHLAATLSRYDATKKQPLSTATINQCLLLVSKIFNQSRLIPYRDDMPQIPLYVGANPCAEVRRKRPNNARWRVFDDAQIDALLAAALERKSLGVRKVYRTDRGTTVFRDAILFSLRTGARLGEVVNLQWQFVCLETGRIRLIDTKSGRDRSVFATGDTLDMLRARCVDPEREPHVFWDEDRPLTDDRMSHVFNHLIHVLGWNDSYTRRQDRLVFHSLRHTYGTRAIMSGMNAITVQRLMGHATLQTTERYVHLADEFLRAQQALHTATSALSSSHSSK